MAVTNHGGVAADGNRLAEGICSIDISGKFGLLAPDVAAPGEHIGRLKGGTDNYRITANGNGPAEFVTSATIAGNQFLLLDPGATASYENIGSAPIRDSSISCWGAPIMAVVPSSLMATEWPK